MAEELMKLYSTLQVVNSSNCEKLELLFIYEYNNLYFLGLAPEAREPALFVSLFVARRRLVLLFLRRRRRLFRRPRLRLRL